MLCMYSVTMDVQYDDGRRCCICTLYYGRAVQVIGVDAVYVQRYY